MRCLVGRSLALYNRTKCFNGKISLLLKQDLSGHMSTETSGLVAEFDSYLMSCRVIGRQAELAFAAALLEQMARSGVQHVRATYVATEKNALVAGFWSEFGLVEITPNSFEMDLRDWSQERQFAIEVSIEASETPGRDFE